ncbi:hypothetical protein ACFL08_03575 [Patescibacteria group bacterium]
MIALLMALWLIHVSWPFWGWFIVKNITQLNSKVISSAVLLVVYACVLALFSGCPFMYVHEYLEVKMGFRKVFTYNIEQCIAYEYIIEPIRECF